MIIRLNTLVLASLARILYRKVLFFMVAAFCSINSHAQSAPNEEVKKTALKLFEDEEYTQAYKLYSQLVANFPKDPEYNFRLGVCMIYSEPDKKKCLPYLKFAYSKPDNSPKETPFYLGKAYHINYLFDEAIKYYLEFKKTGSSSQQKKLQVERELRACGYGKRLLSNLSDLVVLSKKQLNEADYFRSYDLKTVGGKLLAKPDDFKTSADKKKKDKSIVYLPSIGNRVYYSSYGEGENKDIYYATKLPNGTFSKAQKVTGINSDQDEDFPFLHPNGTTIYFASKGFNGMGGYDIFKSTYIEGTDSWTPPVNMEFPINSPDDDYLYVTDSLEKTAWFSTGRQSLPGKIDVLKINTERKPIDVLALKGTVVKESADQSLKSIITVKNMDNGNIVGVFNAGDNGDYFMDLPNGANLLYTVETPGLKTQSDRVGLPTLASSKPLRQTISYDKGILKILNYFDENPGDDSYIQYLKLIEKKAKLDVNQGENKINPTSVSSAEKDPLKTNTTATSSTTSEYPSSANTNSNSATSKTITTKSGLDNKQLAESAKKESEELAKEGNALKQDAGDAFELADQKKIEADKKLKEANDLYKNAEQITNEEEKKQVIEKANTLKAEAETDAAIAAKILNYANALKDDAAVKIKEAELNKQYSDELTKITANKNNTKENLDKLDNIQKEIELVSDQKNKSENIFTAMKNEADEKEKELSKVEKNNEEVKTNIQEIKESIKSSENDLAKAKKKEKESIQTKITELKTEQGEKEKQVAANETEILKVKNELSGLNKSVDLATKVKNETIAVNTSSAITSVETVTTTNNPVSEKITNKTLADKYKDKILVPNNADKAAIEQSNNELIIYNKEIDEAIAKNKIELSKTNNATAKQQFTTEIKQLEASKKQNQQKITANTKKAEDLNKTILASTAKTTTTTSISSVSADNNDDAIKQLENLNSNLNTSDNANFDYNGYQNEEAQKLKIEADAKINEAVAKQKKLKDQIVIAKDQIKNTSSIPTGTVSPKDLNKEAEELNVKAFDLRSQASSKTGADKEALIAQAKELEIKSNEKNLEAAKIIESDNKILFETEKNNLSLLLASKKAPESDVTEAKKLADDANNAFKQAVSMREEANSMPNVGAKLGNLSNAEEKEIEALAKQTQAVNLLKTSSPDVVLKKAVTSSVVTDNSNPGSNVNSNLDNQLLAVNNIVREVQESKVDAYSKLYEANNLELTQLDSELKTNQGAIDKNPALKTEYITSVNKINATRKLQQAALTSKDNNKKISDLIETTKKQTEALNQLSNLNKKVNAAVAKNTANSVTNNNLNNTANTKTPTVNNNNNTASTETVAVTNGANTTTNTSNTINNGNTNNTVATNSTASTNANDSVTNSNSSTAINNPDNGTLTSTTTPNNNNATTNNTTVNTNSVNNNANPNSNNTASSTPITEVNTATVTENNNTINTNTVVNNTSAETSTNSATPNNNNQTTPSTNSITVQALATKDTSAAQLISFFDSEKIKLNSPQANTIVSKTIADLKTIEDENKALEKEISNTGSTAGTSQTSAQLKTEADNLLTEAEDLSVKAFDLKTQANTKTGEEKELLIQKSKELETQSQTKKLEAIKFTEQSNQQTFSTNNAAISDLINKLKSENPNQALQLEEKINEVNTLKTKSQQLRNEAQSQSNNNARIGSMMNAEEKEAEMLQKQNEILDLLKKQYPDYVVKENTVNNSGNGTVPANLLKQQEQLREKQYVSLTNLTNAFSLEYETSKNSVPANLTDDQKIIKQNAEDLNGESRRLLIQSANEKNANEKIKLLTLSAKTGNAAISQLNTIAKKNTAITNNTVNNNNIANNPTNNNANTNRNNNPTLNTVRNNNNQTAATINAATGKGTIKVEGLEVIAGNAYSAAKPIPVDAKVPDGLVFRVQVGAFKTRLADNSFRGLSPLNGETAPNGYIRYTAGNFNKLENANAVKNDLKNLGYTDAFVVVFFNGKRISLNDALTQLAKEGRTVDRTAPQTAGITANVNIPKAAVNNLNLNINAQDAVNVTKELEQINGLLYTVQIGVYNKAVNKRQLFGLNPIYTEKLPNGLFRYTAGIYNNSEKIKTDRNRVINVGIKDAFISAYLNGKRISFAEGKTKQLDGATKMEAENPIVFSDNFTNNPRANFNPITTPVISNATPTVPVKDTTSTTSVQPFTNGITSYPVATAENGIKLSEEGTSYRVQIGAYSKQLPGDVANKFMAIKNWPIENIKINGLFIYSVGNFTEPKFAQALKEEAIRAGVTDAFITIYKDGIKQ